MKKKNVTIRGRFIFCNKGDKKTQSRMKMQIQQNFFTASFTKRETWEAWKVYQNRGIFRFISFVKHWTFGCWFNNTKQSHNSRYRSIDTINELFEIYLGNMTNHSFYVSVGDEMDCLKVFSLCRDGFHCCCILDLVR